MQKLSHAFTYMTKSKSRIIYISFANFWVENIHPSLTRSMTTLVPSQTIAGLRYIFITLHNPKVHLKCLLEVAQNATKPLLSSDAILAKDVVTCVIPRKIYSNRCVIPRKYIQTDIRLDIFFSELHMSRHSWLKWRRSKQFRRLERFRRILSNFYETFQVN